MAPQVGERKEVRIKRSSNDVSYGNRYTKTPNQSIRYLTKCLVV